MKNKKILFDWGLNSRSGGEPLGLTYLRENAKAYWDFMTLAGADGASITSVSDSGPNGISLSNESPAQDPTIQYLQFGSVIYPTYKGFPSSSTLEKDVLIANTTGDNQFKSDFEIIFTCAISATTDYDFFGVALSTNILRFNNTTNKLRFEYRYSATTARRFVADSATPFYSEKTGLRLYRIKCDFTNDIFKVWVDGVDVTMTPIVDAFNLIDPAKWANNTHKLCIGGYNNAGTIGLFSSHKLFGRFAITPLLTDRQALDVSTYFTNL